MKFSGLVGRVLGACLLLAGVPIAVAGCGWSSSHPHPYTIDGVPDNDDFHPSWAPDGRKFVYVRDYQLYVYDVADGRTRQITHGKPLKRDPAWSPSGTEIAYVATSLDTETVVGGTYFCGVVYTVRPDGSGAHRVSPPGAGDCDPAWSPDGTHLAVHGDRANKSTEGLYVMSAGGTQQRAVAYRPNGFESYEWSPDGSKLAFSDFDHGHTYVFDLRNRKVIDIASRMLHAHPALNSQLLEDPNWSPDGRLLAVNVGDPAAGSVWYLVQADGSGSHRVRAPSWLPCGAANGSFWAGACGVAIRSPQGNRTLLDKSNTLLLTGRRQRRPTVIARRAERSG